MSIACWGFESQGRGSRLRVRVSKDDDGLIKGGLFSSFGCS